MISSIEKENRKTLRRFDVPGHAHELTFSCFDKQPYLKDPAICSIFMEEFALAKSYFQFKIWAYVLMPTHVHLLIRPELENYRIAVIQQHMKGKSSTRYRQWILKNAIGRYAGFCVPAKGRKVFRLWLPGGGYDRNIWSGKATHNVIRYIDWNPVRAGLAKTPEEWPWSSAYARFVGKGIMPDMEGIPFKNY